MEEKTRPEWFNEEEFLDFSRNYNEKPFSLEGLFSFHSYVNEDKSSKAAKMDAEMAKGTGVDDQKGRDAARKRVERSSESPPPPEGEMSPEEPPPPSEGQFTPEEIAQMEYQQTYFIDGIPRSLDSIGREEVRATLQPRDISTIVRPLVVGDIPEEVDDRVHYSHAIVMIALQVAGFSSDDIQSRVDNTPQLTQTSIEIFENSKNIVRRLIEDEGWTPQRLAGLAAWSEMGLGDFREAKSELVLYLDQQDALNSLAENEGILGITINLENRIESSNIQDNDVSLSVINTISNYLQNDQTNLVKVYKKFMNSLYKENVNFSNIKDKIISNMIKILKTDGFKIHLLFELLSGKYSFNLNHKFGPVASSDIILTQHTTDFITFEYCESLIKNKAFNLKIKVKSKKNKEINVSNLKYYLDGKLSSTPHLHQLSSILSDYGLMEQMGEGERGDLIAFIESRLPDIIALVCENEFVFDFKIDLHQTKTEKPKVAYNFITINGKEFKVPVSDKVERGTEYSEPPEYPKADEVHVSEMSEERDYKKEYREYHGKPEQRKNRSKRVLARRKLIKQGRVSKGDGKDVHHKNGNPQDNSSDNLQVMSASKNRAIKDSYDPSIEEEHGAGEIGTKELLKKYLKDTPFSKIVGLDDDKLDTAN